MLLAQNINTRREPVGGCLNIQNSRLGARFKKWQTIFQGRLIIASLLTIIPFAMAILSSCLLSCFINTKEASEAVSLRKSCVYVSWVHRACFSKTESPGPQADFIKADYSVKGNWWQTPISVSIFCHGAERLDSVCACVFRGAGSGGASLHDSFRLCFVILSLGFWGAQGCLPGLFPAESFILSVCREVKLR